MNQSNFITSHLVIHVWFDAFSGEKEKVVTSTIASLICEANVLFHISV